MTLKPQGLAALRLVVVGSGRMAWIHAQNALQSGRADVAAVVNPNRASASRLAQAVGGEAVASLADLGDRPIDAVVVTSPSSQHHEAIAWCVDRRLPVFLEKPLADTLDASRRVRDLVVGAGLTCVVAFQRRFDPTFATVRDEAAAGLVGDVEHVLTISRDREPPPESYIPPSGGIFRDLGVHDIDLVRQVMGPDDPVARIFAQGMVGGARYIGKYGDLEEGQAMLKFRSGRTAVIMLSRSAVYGYDVRVEVWGSGGALRGGYLVEPSVHRLVADGVRQVTVQGFAERFAAAYRAEVAAFLGHLRGEPNTGATVDDALTVTEIAEACARSVAEGRPVAFEEVAG